MTLRFCDGATFHRALIAAVATLDRHAAEVDSLNVFPVPDGDTGRNMLATMRGALDHAAALAGRDRTLGGVADALAHGALMGARGNSGVILSQVLRGIAEGVRGMRRADGLQLAHALHGGSRAADASVDRPVEGTILSVVRAAAHAAVSAAEAEPTLSAALSAAVEAAAEAVIRTPDQLTVLREAGVVDAGGRGFELLLRGVLVGMIEPGRDRGVTVPARMGAPMRAEAEPDAAWGYETMYLLTARPDRPLDVDRMRAELRTLGDSVLVVGDARVARVHLHSERPDLALGYGLQHGSLSRVTVENLDLLTAGEREERAEELLSSTPPDRSVFAEGAGGRLAVVAVAAGAGIARALEAAGATAVGCGAQADHPSTGDLVAAIRRAGAETVVVLPNHPNVRLAAQQAAALSAPIAVHVVATRNAAEGLAAVLALDPRAPTGDNVTRMERAAGSVRSCSVTTAVRDARLGGRRIRTGDAIALDPDDGLVAVGRDRFEVALEAARHVADGAELVTILCGADADAEEARRLAERLRAALPSVEVDILDGGQPHHAYLVAAE